MASRLLLLPPGLRERMADANGRPCGATPLALNTSIGGGSPTTPSVERAALRKTLPTQSLSARKLVNHAASGESAPLRAAPSAPHGVSGASISIRRWTKLSRMDRETSPTAACFFLAAARCAGAPERDARRSSQAASAKPCPGSVAAGRFGPRADPTIGGPRTASTTRIERRRSVLAHRWRPSLSNRPSHHWR